MPSADPSTRGGGRPLLGGAPWYVEKQEGTDHAPGVSVLLNRKSFQTGKEAQIHHRAEYKICMNGPGLERTLETGRSLAATPHASYRTGGIPPGIQGP